MVPSHLPTHGYHHVCCRSLASHASILDLSNNVESIDNLAEDDVLVVQKWSGYGADEELAAVGVWSRVLYHEVNMAE